MIQRIAKVHRILWWGVATPSSLSLSAAATHERRERAALQHLSREKEGYARATLGKRPPTPIWQKPSFLLFWGGQSLSNLGDAFALVAIPLLVLQATGSTAQMGLVTATFGIGRLLAGVVAGPVVDHVDRRVFMMVCDASRLVLYGSIPCLWLFAGPQLWLVYVVMALGAVIGMGFQVAYVTAVVNLVEVEQITSANSVLQGTLSLTYVFGPLLAGIVAAALGPATALGVDALSFGISVLSLTCIRFRSPSSASSSEMLLQEREQTYAASEVSQQSVPLGLRKYRLHPLELEKSPTGPLLLQDIEQACAASEALQRSRPLSLRKYRLLPLELEPFPHHQQGTEKPSAQMSALRSVGSELLAGFHYLWQHRLLRTMMLLRAGVGVVFLSGGVGGTLDLFIFHLVHDLHQPQTAVGEVLGVASIGGIAGALLAPVLRRRLGFGWCWPTAVALAGVATMGAGLAPTTAILAPLTILLLFGSSLGSISELSLRQAITPDAFLGRVSAAFTTASTIASAVGTILITNLASVLGTSWGLGLAGMWVVGLAILSCFTTINEHGGHHQASKRQKNREEQD